MKLQLLITFIVFFNVSLYGQLTITVPAGTTQTLSASGTYSNIEVFGTLNIDSGVTINMVSYGQLNMDASGELYIEENVTIEFPSSCTSCKINNSGRIENSGTIIAGTIDNRPGSEFIITTTGNLYRNDDLAFDASEFSGDFLVYQEGTSNNWEYNYWSTPIYSNTPTFDDSFTNSTRHYEMINGGIYDWITQNHLNWTTVNASTQMTIGKGYAINGPWSLTTATPRPGDNATTNLDTRLFYGKRDYYGDLAVSVIENFNLIGNPFPTALDIKSFIDDNIVDLKEGSVFLWDGNHLISGTNSNLITSGIYAGKYIPDGYISVNTLGSVPTDQNGDSLTELNKTQGFVINVENGVSNITINRSARSSSNSSLFYRNSNRIDEEDSSQHKLLWLGMYNENLDIGDEVLFGFVDEGATLGFDKLYDATKKYSGENVYLKMPLDEKNLVIQGYPSTLLQEESEISVPLNVIVTQDGDYTFSILQTKNFPEGIDMYIRDTQDMSLQSLELEPVFNLYNSEDNSSRFQLVFKPSVLASEEFNEDENPKVRFEDNNIVISNIDVSKIDQIACYNINGQKVFSKSQEEISRYMRIENLTQGTYIIELEVAGKKVGIKTLKR